MSRPGAWSVLFAVLLVGMVPAAGASGGTGAGGFGALATQQEFDSTEFRITVAENGSARWTFMYKKTLNDSNRQEFETYAERFNENETELYRTFRDRARALTRAGSNATGRQMDATAFSKEAYVTNLGNRGVVAMSFTWTNFAPVQNGRVIIGDVFEGGLYIGPDQRLVVQEGESLTIQSVDPEPDSTSEDAVTWIGEREFSDNRPRVVLANESAAGGDGGASPTDGQMPDDDAAGSATPLVWVLALVVVLAVVAGVVWRTDVLGRGGSESEQSATGTGAGDAAEDGTSEVTEEAADAESGAGGGPSADETEPAVSDEELLSDEERVERLLEEHGGRMKQVNIVEETGWSKSKVSMLLSEMEEEGDISKLRIGRENVISLPGHEPEGTGSPFDEE